jgi:hypothetical protein
VTHNPLVCADGWNLVGENLHTLKKKDKNEIVDPTSYGFHDMLIYDTTRFDLRTILRKMTRPLHIKNKETIRYTCDYRQKVDEEWDHK